MMFEPYKMRKPHYFEWWCGHCFFSTGTSFSTVQEKEGKLAVHLCPNCMGVLHVRLAPIGTGFFEFSYVYAPYIPHDLVRHRVPKNIVRLDV